MLSAFNEYFESLRGKKIAVLGLGVSNRPLVRLLLEFGCDVTGCDRTPREKLDQEVLDLEMMGCKLSVGDGYLDGLEADIVFRTPGMHPGNPAIRALADKGAYVTSEMEVFFEVCPCNLIAVTGSDGKSARRRILSPSYHLPMANPKTIADVDCVFAASTLPPAPLKVEVRPVSCFDKAGRPLTKEIV